MKQENFSTDNEIFTILHMINSKLYDFKVCQILHTNMERFHKATYNIFKRVIIIASNLISNILSIAVI